ncbi:hypothetical protein DRF57_17800 [Chryseobacterium rhizosphaerae]|uniref:Uncharacterized protein n=1 Tax=Chryseobacterium rhizosphaerae TaxID=395937 RepID=A0ABX9IGQ9_9FLAO|nr:hypothetical protein DRF57_17800 [Chryseobacterium rhizosphaerae]
MFILFVGISQRRKVFTFYVRFKAQENQRFSASDRLCYLVYKIQSVPSGALFCLYMDFFNIESVK